MLLPTAKGRKTMCKFGKKNRLKLAILLPISQKAAGISPKPARLVRSRACYYLVVYHNLLCMSFDFFSNFMECFQGVLTIRQICGNLQAPSEKMATFAAPLKKFPPLQIGELRE